MISQYKKELDMILEGYSICPVKLCNIYPNGKRKRFLKTEVKNLASDSNETIFRKLKRIFKI